MHTINIKRAVTGALVLGMLAPAFAFADTTTAPKVTSKNFCSSLSSIHDRTLNNVTGNESDLMQKLENRLGEKSIRWTTLDQKLSDKRIKGDQDKAARYAKMYTRAKTDAQKAALDTYKAATEKAVTDRRTAVDAAIKTFRDSVNTIFTGTNGSTKTAYEAFKASIETAFTTAQSDCTAAIKKPADIRSAFETSVKAARKVLETAVNTPDIRNQVTALATTRKTSFTAAESAYKDAMTKAHTDLRTAFK
jgi:hypothetical protein